MEKLYSTKLNENNQIREKYLLDVSYDRSSKALQNKADMVNMLIYKKKKALNSQQKNNKV